MKEWTQDEREAARARAERATQLIASVNRVRLSPDDPILVIDTLLHDFLSQADERHKEAMRALAADLERVRLSWDETSRHRAETVLTAALEASRDAIGADLENASAQLARTSAATLNAAVIDQLAPLAAGVRMAHRLAWLNVLAAALTVFAAAITVAALIHFR